MISALTAGAARAVGPAAAAGMGDGVALLIVLAFLTLLACKEATTTTAAASGRRRHNLDRGLNLAIVPLGCATLLIVGERFLVALR
jgi:hypothetical protein